MIHYEQDINQSNGHTILECLDRLDGNLVHPSLIPVRENTRLQTNIVDFKSLLEYTNTSGYSAFTEAVNDIKNYNHIQNLTVSIDEAYIYDMPEIVNLFESYVIKPISKNSVEYKLAEEYLSTYMQTRNPEVLNEYNELTGLNVGTDILNELSNNSALHAASVADMKRQQAMAVGDYDKAAKYSQQADRLAAKAQNRQAQLKQLRSDMSNKQYDDIDEKNKMQAKINNLAGVKTANPSTSKPNTTNTTPNSSNNAGQAAADVVSSISGASGNNQGPSWWARNFAAFKNWMNNNFGTKFNTAIGGFDSYSKFKDFAANTAKNFASTQTGQQLIDKGINKAQEFGNKQGGLIKQGIDMATQFVNDMRKPANAATEITAGTILSEVYRPRRMYRSTYMRMH